MFGGAPGRDERAALGLFLFDSPPASADRAPCWGLHTTPGPRVHARPWRSGLHGPWAACPCSASTVGAVAQCPAWALRVAPTLQRAQARAPARAAAASRQPSPLKGWR